VEEKMALLQDAIKARKYRQGIRHFNGIITSFPDLNYSMYVHGATIYDALATNEKDVI